VAAHLPAHALLRREGKTDSMEPMPVPTNSELVRRIEHLVRCGSIAEVDHAQSRCRVAAGALLSAWVPWLALRAGRTRHWSPPTVGEQCLLLSPGGEPAAGVALVGIYSDESPAPSTSESVHATHFPDGGILIYDHAGHSLVALLPGDSSVEVSATRATLNVEQLTVNAQATTWNGAIQLNGHMDSTGDVTAGGVSLISHVHGGVDRGNSQSDAPA
jgi:phage baseplate assembly protein V